MRKIILFVLVNYVFLSFAQTHTSFHQTKSKCPNSLGVFANNSAISCTSMCTANATVYVVSNGTPPYTYTWNPTGANTPTVTNVCPANYTITVKDALGCFGEANLVILNNAGPCAGIKEYSINNLINIFPNPVHETLNISNERNEFENSEVEITNTLGQTVLKLPYSNTIDVSTLSRGYYNLKIVSNNKQPDYSKFIKE